MRDLYQLVTHVFVLSVIFICARITPNYNIIAWHISTILYSKTIKTYLSNLVRTTRFWNNLHQVLSISKDWKVITGYVYICIASLMIMQLCNWCYCPYILLCQLYFSHVFRLNKSLIFVTICSLIWKLSVSRDTRKPGKFIIIFTKSVK